MEGQGQGQRERTNNRRRQRRKAKAARNKLVVEPELIAARRPDSPLLKNGFVIASAAPKGQAGAGSHKHGSSVSFENDSEQHVNGASAFAAVANGHPAPGSTEAGHVMEKNVLGKNAFETDGSNTNGADAHGSEAHGSEANGGTVQVRRRAVRIVKVTDTVLGPGNREQQLLDRLVRSQGRGAISRAADDLWEGKFVPPKRQDVQIQLLEHENEQRARDAVFAIAELLQREAPIQRPVLDQRLRRLEQSAEDPITRDAAGALRRSMRVHYGA